MKYTNEGRLGAERAASYNKREAMPDNAPNSQPPAAQKVDPSVKLGDLKGEIMGNVPLDEQMRKPQAYRP